MQRSLVRMYGILIALLAVGGFLVSDGHLLGLMNADTALDWLRALLAIVLLYVGFSVRNLSLVRESLLFVGVLYVGMAVAGLIDSQLWGLLPNGLTGFDIAFHLITGILALGVGASKPAAHQATS